MSSTNYKGKLHFVESELVTKYDDKNAPSFKLSSDLQLKSRIISHKIKKKELDLKSGISTKSSKKPDGKIDYRDIVEIMDDVIVSGTEFDNLVHSAPKLCQDCNTDRAESKEENKRLMAAKLKLVGILFECILQTVPSEKIEQIVHEEFYDDPEFLLKTAFYSRKELNIRTVSNELLAIAATCKETKFYLKKYYKTCINTPNDWIEVAYSYMKINKTNKFPAQLRKVMTDKFSEFSIYQLGKYSGKKKRVDIGKTQYTLSLKSLIRQLHISQPAEPVMCIIGKPYPADPEQFRLSQLPGIFDSSRAGKRMKLPIPETWETQISAHGNKAEIWQKLIDNKSLPYMATIRNIRNLVLSTLDTKHHNIVINNICNEESVIKGKMLPMQYYTAHKVLENLENGKDSEGKPTENKNIDTALTKRYKSALNNAIVISSHYNIPPIRGKLLILGNLADSTSTVSKFGFIKGRDEMTALLIAMCQLAAEYTETYLLNKQNRVGKYNINLIVKKSILTLAKSILKDRDSSDKYNQINDVLIDKVESIDSFDTIILFGVDVENAWIENYVNAVNPNVNIYRVFYKHADVAMAEDLPNTRNINGLTEQMLKFISEQSNGGTTQLIDRIDRKYQLADIDISAVTTDASSSGAPNKLDSSNTYSINAMIPLDKASMKTTYTIFLSSTFTDMADERDYLNRVAMPYLQRKLQNYNSMLSINWVDLRWGIPKSWGTNERLLDHCLHLSSNSDYFIGVYGNRYGWIPDKKMVENLQVKYPILNKNRKYSVTRLEYMCAHDSDCENFIYVKDVPISSPPAKKSKLSAWTHEKMKDFRNYLASIYDDEDEDAKNGKQFSYQDSKQFKSQVDQMTDQIYNDIIRKHAISDEDMETEEKMVSNKQCIVHRRNLRYSYVQHYQTEILANGLFHQIDESNFAEEIQLLNNLIDEELVMRCRYFFNGLDRDTDANKRKNKSHHVRLDGDLVERMSKNGTVPGGILLIHGSAYAGKSNIGASLFNFISKKVQKDNEATLAKHAIEHVNYLWRYENVRDIDEKNGQETGFYNLLYDLIEFFMRHFSSQLIPSLKKRLRDLSRGIDTALKYFWISDDVRNMILIWNSILKTLTVPKNVKVTVFLDGIEKLSDQSEVSNMNWIPLLLPSNVRFVVVTTTKSRIHLALQKRKNYVEHEIYSIPLVSKKKIIEELLSRRGKTLDDSHINNEVQELCLKKDSSKPFYLNLAISYLSNFGDFEYIYEQIVKLPNTTLELISHTLKRLEKEMSKPILVVYLSFLMNCKSGFRQELLQQMMGIYFVVAESAQKLYFGKDCEYLIKELASRRNDKPSFPPFPLVLFNNTSGIVEETSCGYIQLKEIPGCSEILEKYTKIVNQMSIRKIITESFEDLVLRSTNNQCIYREIVHYFLLAGDVSSAVKYLTNLRFVSLKFTMDVADSLLQDYLNCLRVLNESDDFKMVEDFHRFVIKNYHGFIANPKGIIQQAFYEPKDSYVKSVLDETMRQRNSSEETRSALWSDKPELTLIPNEYFLQNLRTPQFECRIKEVISCCTVIQETCKSKDTESMETDTKGDEKNNIEDLVIVGCESGQIFMFSLSGLELRQCLYHHFCRINALTVCETSVPKLTQLVSGDENGQIAVWNVATGALIVQLQQQHDKAITGICWCAPLDLFCSVGLDFKLVLWNINDYRVSTTQRLKSPINCVELIPNTTLIVIGMWSGSINIFDISSMKRTAVFHHHCSVRSISVSNLDTECIMFSDIKCQCLAVNKSGEHRFMADVNDMTYNWGDCCCQAVGMSTSARRLGDGSSFIMYPGVTAAVTKEYVVSSRHNSKVDVVIGSGVSRIFNKQINKMIHCWDFSETISSMRVSKKIVLFGAQNGTITMYPINVKNGDDLSRPIDTIFISTAEIHRIIANYANHDQFFVVDFKGQCFMIDDITSSSSRKIIKIEHDIHQGYTINCGRLQKNLLVSGADDCNVIFTEFGDLENSSTQIVKTVKFDNLFSSSITCISNRNWKKYSQYVAVGSKEAKIAIFDFENTALLYSISEPHQDWVTGIFIKEDFMLTCSGPAQTVTLTRLAATTKKKESDMVLYSKHVKAFVNALCEDAICLSDGHLIELDELYYRDHIILRDVNTNEPLSIVDVQSNGLEDMKIMLDSKNRAYFYDNYSDNELSISLDHQGSITDVCVMNDDRFCTVSRDGSLKLWNCFKTVFSDKHPELPPLKITSGSSSKILEILFVQWEDQDLLITYETCGLLRINNPDNLENYYDVHFPKDFFKCFNGGNKNRKDCKNAKYPCESLASEGDLVLIKFQNCLFSYNLRSRQCNSDSSSIETDKLKLNKKMEYSIEFAEFRCNVTIKNDDLTLFAEVINSKSGTNQTSDMPLLCPVQSGTLGKTRKADSSPFVYLVYTNGLVQKIMLMDFS